MGRKIACLEVESCESRQKRYFGALNASFTTALARHDGGETISSESVRERIRMLIEAEKTDAVLSDDRLAEILSSEGIDIARRTVAKYREAMRIASSAQRRREKRDGG